MKPGEKFVSFVEFNRYEDIGFYPDNMSIECCSCFLFVTSKTSDSLDSQINSTKLNLLLADPYGDKI